MAKKATSGKDLGNSVLSIPIKAHVVIPLVGLAAWAVYTLIVFTQDATKLSTPPGVLVFDKALMIFAACVTAYAAIYATLFSRWRVRSTAVELRAERLRRTFDLLRHLDQDDRVNMRIQIRLAFSATEIVDGKEKPKISPEDLVAVEAALMENDAALRHAVGKTLGSFEDLSLAIKLGYADEGLVHRSLAGVVCRHFEWLHHWVIKQQAEDPTIYREFIELATAWRNKKSVNDVAKDVPEPDTAFLDLTDNAG
jgi:hypothetical protein